MTDHNPPQWAIDAANEALDRYYADDSSTPERAARIIARHAPESPWKGLIAHDLTITTDVIATVRQAIEDTRADKSPPHWELESSSQDWRDGHNTALDTLKRRLDELFHV